MMGSLRVSVPGLSRTTDDHSEGVIQGMVVFAQPHHGLVQLWFVEKPLIILD